MTNDTIRCDRLDELLPDWLEGSLDAATRSAVEAHLAGCARCASIVADLSAITTAARQLPDLEPPRDLWGDISERIATPVVALPAERERRASRRERLRLFAAAAALVVMSAGATFVGTRYWLGQSAPTRLANNPAPILGGPGAPTSGASETEPVRSTVTDVGTPNAAMSDTGTPDERGSAGTPATPRSTTAEPPRVQNASRRTSAELAYDREIQQLRGLLDARRAELDPATVAVVERNLNVIDEAIRQSRDALRRDPASRFLNDQLNNALDKKVELLRAAAMLPSRS